MADTYDLLTLNEGKTAINLATSVTTHDTELAMFITGISRRFDDILGPVVQRAVTERHHGGDCSVLLRQTPVASVTTVVEWTTSGTSTSLTAETDSTKPASAYLLVHNHNHTARLLRRTAGNTVAFEVGTNNIVVTFQAGRYANTAAVDALFKLAAANCLRRIWQRESKTWAQTPDGFGSPDGVDVGFFRVIDPVIREWFPAELPPLVG